MDIQHLIKMANQIGDYFESYPDKNEAASEIATHLKKFWEPRMRRQMLAYIDSDNGEGLSPEVLAAIRQYRQKLEPQAA